ncbi:hypothetical protein CRUP_012592 [Coryphaenoides rupestris]|nr:hypothetical protein CRUP_012592 [Coryphaenoides rupestris]
MAQRTVLYSAGCVVTLLSGYVLWKVVPPGEQRTQQIIQNLPEANPLRREESRQRSILMLQVLKEAAETDTNVARGFTPGKRGDPEPPRAPGGGFPPGK